MTSTPLDHVVALGRLFDALRVPWVLGGSLASSLVGEPRSTLDIEEAQLIAAVENDYHVSLEMARDAMRPQTKCCES